MIKKELQTVYIPIRFESDFSLRKRNNFDGFLTKSKGIFFTQEEFNTFLEEYTEEVLKTAAKNADTLSVSYFSVDNEQKDKGVDIWEEGCSVPSFLAITDKESITNLLPEILKKYKI